MNGTKLPGAVTKKAEITLLDIDISVEEYLTFFPLLYSRRRGLRRLIRNQWNEYSIVAYINWAREVTGRHAIDFNTLTKEV